jgi:hypothetical protein
LREIGEDAFSHHFKLKSFDVPSSVGTIGDRCFDGCKEMATIRFQEPSRLKTIGKRAFAGCRLSTITIPASVETIDGSAFVGCPLLGIGVAMESQRFKIEGTLLTTADGTKIVRYFGRGREVFVRKTVEVLGNSCFESSNYFERVVFENGSKLRQIGCSAFSGCEFLTSIAIPVSVVAIGESAFKECDGLEECLIDENAVLVKIEDGAFAGCCSLRSFYFPSTVAGIGKKCFERCGCLHQLTFGSGATLKTLVCDVTLHVALENIGFADITGLFKIEVNEEEVNLDFRGWLSFSDGGSSLVFVQDNE